MGRLFFGMFVLFLVVFATGYLAPEKVQSWATPLILILAFIFLIGSVFLEW